jgi:hypothetical protein
MKDMLASLPQYQEQREKVIRSAYAGQVTHIFLVLVTLEYGTGMYGYI